MRYFQILHLRYGETPATEATKSSFSALAPCVSDQTGHLPLAPSKKSARDSPRAGCGLRDNLIREVKDRS
jgi:hypothetical protein